MEKYIPYEKLSKKEKRRLAASAEPHGAASIPSPGNPTTARPTIETKPGIGDVKTSSGNFICFWRLKQL